MEPYYNDGTVTIYHGDCREVIPSLDAADLLLTDPPYGVGWQSSRGYHEKIVGDDGSLAVASWLPLALRSIRRGRHAYVFGMIARDVPADAPMCGFAELIWDKGVMGLGSIESPWGPMHERILFGVQEISKTNRAKNYGVTAARLRKGSVIHVQRPHSGQTRTVAEDGHVPEQANRRRGAPMSETSVDPVEEARLAFVASARRAFESGLDVDQEAAAGAQNEWRAAILASDPRVQALEAVARAATAVVECGSDDSEIIYQPLLDALATAVEALAALQEETGRGEDGDGRTTM